MPPSILKCFRLLADPIRVRIVLLLQQEELSVAELQEVLNVGQSRISMNLSQMKQAGLVEDRRTGKHSLYTIPPGVRQCEELMALLKQAGREVAESGQDREGLARTLRKRHAKVRAYFDDRAGRFGKHYVPGRSWKGLAEALMKLMPRQVVADL